MCEYRIRANFIEIFDNVSLLNCSADSPICMSLKFSTTLCQSFDAFIRDYSIYANHLMFSFVMTRYQSFDVFLCDRKLRRHVLQTRSLHV